MHEYKCSQNNRHGTGLAFSTGISEQYHRPGDDATIINYSGMVKISRYLRATLIGLQRKEIMLH